MIETPLVTVGLFRCRPWEPWFEDSGPIGNHIIVFPRTGVLITHAGREPVVANPNVVMFYNRGQVYRRGKLSERGDLCEWFAFDHQVIADVLRPHDRGVEDRVDRPFQLTHGPSDPSSYLLQRMVVEHLLGHRYPDYLYIEEAMLTVLGRVVESVYRARTGIARNSRSNGNSDHRELTQAVQTLLATRFQEPLRLTQIAAEMHCSPYHLCHIFRQQAGFTIHRYLNQIRLRTALEYVTQGETDLTGLALTLGYSSHSHFTESFRRAFGTPPSDLRCLPVSRYLREMSKNLIA